MEIRGNEFTGPGHRRRRATRRPRLGPAAGRLRGRRVHRRRTASTRAKIPTRPAGCGASAKTPSARCRPAAKASISCDYKGQAVRVEVTREKFEEMTHDLLDRTQFTTRQTLQAAGLSWNDIDHVLLVGGSTRMPMVAKMLARAVGQGARRLGRGRRGGGPRRGAARRRFCWPRRAARRRVLKIKQRQLAQPGRGGHRRAAPSRKRNAILIPRNTPLPVTAKRVFRTQKAGQQSILVQIVEGESASPDDCSQIGKCVVRDLPADLPAQTPIEVRFHYEENGRLTVHVSVAGTDTRTEARDHPREQPDPRAARRLAAVHHRPAHPASRSTCRPTSQTRIARLDTSPSFPTWTICELQTTTTSVGPPCPHYLPARCPTPPAFCRPRWLGVISRRGAKSLPSFL